MAQVPKAAAVSTPQPVANARSVGPSTRVAAFATSQIDALNSGTNISFDAAASGFQEGRTKPQQGEDRRDRHFGERATVRLFKTDSQAFAKIFEARNNDDNNPKARHQSNYGGTVAKAIGTYEGNAIVISGNAPVRGTTFSFSL